MINPVQLALYLLSGVALMMLFLHLGFVLRFKSNEKQYLYYGLAIAPLPIYPLLTAFIYQAETADEIIQIIRFQMFLTPIMLLFYPRFIAHYIGIIQPKILTFITLFFAPIPFLRLFSPKLLTYTGELGVKITTLPWGEDLTTITAQITAFGYVYFLAIIALFLYLSVLVINYWRINPQRGMPILLIQSLLLLGIVNDIVVDTFGLAWFYWGEFALSLTIVLMGFHLIEEMLQGLKLKKNLAAKESLLDQIVQSSGASLFSINAEGIFTLVNEEFCHLTTIKEEEIVGNHYLKVKGSPYFETLIPELQQLFDKHKSVTFESELKSGDKTKQYYTTLVPTQNRISGAVGLCTDITELSSVRKQLAQTEKMSAIGQLAGGIAHDFNNMLSGIIGSTELLKIEIRDPSKTTNQFLNLIMETSQRAADLTKKLLLFSRTGTKQVAPCNLTTLLTDTVTMLARTIDKSISVRLENNAINTVIPGDSSILQNVFLNIGINASHAMPNGGDLLFRMENTIINEEYCRASPFDISSGEFVEISIRDTGTGIPPELISKIFDPFFTTKEQGKGTGLGLSAAYGAIHDHHGAITVYSEVGTGTVFHIYLPVSKEKTTTNENEIQLIFGTGTILLVDDEELIRTVGTTLIKQLGYSVETANNGKEAVELFSKNPSRYQLIILDMIMPVMNGREAVEKILDIDATCPIIISSGFSKDNDMNELSTKGVRGFIPKPYKQSELSQIIAENIRPAEQGTSSH